jgi:hypothetical protein
VLRNTVSTRAHRCDWTSISKAEQLPTRLQSLVAIRR